MNSYFFNPFQATIFPGLMNDPYAERLRLVSDYWLSLFSIKPDPLYFYHLARLNGYFMQEWMSGNKSHDHFTGTLPTFPASSPAMSALAAPVAMGVLQGLHQFNRMAMAQVNQLVNEPEVPDNVKKALEDMIPLMDRMGGLLSTMNGSIQGRLLNPFSYASADDESQQESIDRQMIPLMRDVFSWVVKYQDVLMQNASRTINVYPMNGNSNSNSNSNGKLNGN